MQYRTAKQNIKPKKSNLDNPLAVLGIVLLSVVLLLALAELINYKPVYKQAITPKQPEDSIKLQNPSKPIVNSKLDQIKNRIEKAKDTTELESILEEVKSDNAANIKTINEFEFKELEKSISLRKIKLKNSKEDPVPIIVEEPITSIPANYQQMLRSTAFDLAMASNLKNQYSGYDRTVIDALDYYKKVSQHKADYLTIITELRKMEDNSYFEDAERLMKKRFNNKTIDNFESDDEFLLDPKPSWITAAQEAEIRRWGDEIDEELERLDSDY